MKNIFLMFVAATLGGVIGSILTAQFAVPRVGGNQKIVARELTLLNEHNKPAASVTSMNGRSVLSFLDNSGNRAVEVGVDLAQDSRFLVLRGKNGSVTAAISSQSPNGQATIELGDDSWEGKLLLGALQISDEPTVSPSWGLQFSRHDPRTPEFALVAEHGHPPTLLSIRRSDGTYWSVP